ncbi:IS66 family insertion sequence element accessory protein TnpA [Sphingobacterium suaedae]|uniref:IS66 family insertion sequence element accessory protein TnpA n=1 Tax=Sphingobacterium suaedae TaxID=1686402 RepID=UPI0036D34114
MQMFAMIADWQQSGMSKKRYCAEKGINEATFYYWYSRNKESISSPGIRPTKYIFSERCIMGSFAK